jgi:hypothetical protein
MSSCDQCPAGYYGDSQGARNCLEVHKFVLTLCVQFAVLFVLLRFLYL